jgi:Cu+-exporting ATPase
VKQTIDKLHSMNIEVIMLTWDTKNTAEFIGTQIWIDTIISEVMPEDKLEVIKKIQSENKKVAFVWDGINDAPALTQSDLAIAMWTGSDIAIESSDIVLVKWNLEKVVSSIHLSRQTLRIIKQNLFWAFIYNTIWIPLAAFGILSPIFASFAMSMSSVSVISNSLRLKMFK